MVREGGSFPDRVSIDLRPSVVARRERFGDWEGDTVEGGKGTGAPYNTRGEEVSLSHRGEAHRQEGLDHDGTEYRTLQKNAPETPPHADPR